MLMSEVVEKPAENSNSEPVRRAFGRGLCRYGVEPEIQAYAMAKYSRSALSMKESLREISQQKAEKFLNTFYFQYGHRSIADLAHIALAIERLSILAAIAVADEQRWDGQERSTRYQDFKKSGYYAPDFGEDSRSQDSFYRETVDSLFAEYESLSESMFLYLASITPKPDGDEAGSLRAHLAGARLRYLPLPASAGGQHFAGRDRQRAHAGKPGVASARAYSQGNPAIGRVAEACGDLSRVQREPGVADGTGRADSRRLA